MAHDHRSSARSKRQAGGAPRRLTRVPKLAFACIALWTVPVQAADEVRISRLSDVAFGSIANLSTDYVRATDVCLYAKSPPRNTYRITASGSGAGGAFALASGGATLPFEVQWADTPGQTTGTQLAANQPAIGLHSTAGPGDLGDCSKAAATTASLIVVLRSTALAAAISGDYSGTLTLLVAPE